MPVTLGMLFPAKLDFKALEFFAGMFQSPPQDLVILFLIV